MYYYASLFNKLLSFCLFSRSGAALYVNKNEAKYNLLIMHHLFLLYTLY